MTDRQARIATRAYEIWEAAGRPEGHDLENWLTAEAEVAEPDRQEDDVEAHPPISEIGGAGEGQVDDPSVPPAVLSGDAAPSPSRKADDTREAAPPPSKQKARKRESSARSMVR